MKKFVRSRMDSRLGGVCGGLADFTGIDSTIIRLLFFAGVFTPFPVIIFYLACWFIVPQESF
jgi:phage shock protein PspC (stress-responsive transcriptional regulator)